VIDTIGYWRRVAGCEISIAYATEHGLGRTDLGLANGSRCLNVHNDAEPHIDQIVVGIGKEGRARETTFLRSVFRGLPFLMAGETTAQSPTILHPSDRSGIALGV
jgi:hypothetical protein